jgi:hypothetical protein
MTKNKNIPQWQKSVFDNSVDKTSVSKQSQFQLQ